MNRHRQREANMTLTNTARAPWHFWAVAVILVLWNGVAAYDYILSAVQGDAYYESSGMTAAQKAYFSTLPLWVTVAWTVSVWSGAAGGLAYLLRLRLAAVLLTVSVAGTLAYIAHTYFLSDGRAAMGALWPMPVVVAVVMTGLVAYIGVLGRSGVVR
jgi:hypothetical protein